MTRSDFIACALERPNHWALHRYSRFGFLPYFFSSTLAPKEHIPDRDILRLRSLDLGRAPLAKCLPFRNRGQTETVCNPFPQCLTFPCTPNAKVSGVQHGANARATMAKPCPSRRGVLNVRMRSKATNDLTALLDSLRKSQQVPIAISNAKLSCTIGHFFERPNDTCGAFYGLVVGRDFIYEKVNRSC